MNCGRTKANVRWQMMSRIDPSISIEAALPLLSTYLPRIGVMPTARSGKTAKMDSADWRQ